MRRIAALILLVAACGGDTPGLPFGSSTTAATTTTAASTTGATTTTAAPTTTSTTLPAETTTTTEPPLGVFRVVVIVDLSSEAVTREQAQDLVDTASLIHRDLSGFAVEMVDFVEAVAPTSSGTRDLDALVRDYESAHWPDMPDGFMIFSYGHDDTAAAFGGYTYTLPAPPDHAYRFVSTFHPEPIYHIGVVHFGHKYARCGYAEDSTPTDPPISGVSIGGECRNQAGTPCVEQNGYSMCVTALADLYASTVTYFAAATIVHETMHNFGVDVATDHYGTPACDAAMPTSGSTRPYDSESTEEFQRYAGICPFLYDRFVASYTG